VWACRQCGQSVESRFRFCPWCAAPLRRKLTELFAGRDGQALRVSRYVEPDEGEPHVRFSVWSADGEAAAAVSLEDDEAARLAEFLASGSPGAPLKGVDRVCALLARVGLHR
jgi:hypothetical protein